MKNNKNEDLLTLKRRTKKPRIIWKPNDYREPWRLRSHRRLLCLFTLIVWSQLWVGGGNLNRTCPRLHLFSPFVFKLVFALFCLWQTRNKLEVYLEPKSSFLFNRESHCSRYRRGQRHAEYSFSCSFREYFCFVFQKHASGYGERSHEALETCREGYAQV